MEDHDEDNSDRFNAWFSGPNNALVKALAQKARYPVLSRDVVKASLLQLGMQSYDYTSGCLSLFAQAVRDELSEPLSATERRIFDAMYLPQDCYGGLPLVLLLERSDLIGPVVTQLWESPHDAPLVGALHRLLQTYADLAVARRTADRHFAVLRRAR